MKHFNTKLTIVKVWSEEGKFLGNVSLSKSEMKYFAHKIVKARIALDVNQITLLGIDEEGFITLEQGN